MKKMSRVCHNVRFTEVIKELYFLTVFGGYIFLSLFRKVQPRPAGEKRAVVMLAGFLSPPLLWRKMAARLHALGHPVYAPDLHLQLGDAEHNARKLERYLKEHDIRDAWFLAHSLAGLIAASLNAGARKRFQKIFLMGVPLRGTRLALLFPCLSLVRQGIPGSRYLKSIEGHFDHDPGVRCIYAAVDDIILPNASVRLFRKDDLLFPHFGHLNMFMSRESFDFVADLLAQEEKQLPAVRGKKKQGKRVGNQRSKKQKES